MRINLANTRLFRGMEPTDIDGMLGCLHAKERAYKKGDIIFVEGAPAEQIGVVLSGRVIIELGAEYSRRRTPACRASRSWSTSPPPRIQKRFY